MTRIPTDLLAEIPHVRADLLCGRFLGSMIFFEGCYFATKPVDPHDTFVPFLDFTGRIIALQRIQKPFSGVCDDLHNLAASLAKLTHLQSASEQIPHGLSRMVASEVEYIILVCRSLFDLLQEVIQKVWATIRLYELKTNRKPLKESFARTILEDNKPLAPHQISTRFGLPLELAECYGNATKIFLALRRLRDNIVHHGSQVPHIFAVDNCFLISSNQSPFPEMEIWEESERRQNNLVPLLPALETLIYRTLSVCDDFSGTLVRLIEFPPPTVPDMRLYIRCYFGSALNAALESGKRRSAI
jgi:hypothetical protein